MFKRFQICIRVLALAAALGCAAPEVHAAEPVARMAFTRGWATFGLAVPASAARDGLKVGTFPTQTDVKVRWPDGSIRFAIVTARITSAGTYAITPAPAPIGGGAIGTAPPRASVALTIQGRPYTAAVIPARTDPWLNGPLVVEYRSVVAPGMHPFLRVIFDVRSYNDGGGRVDATVENCLDADAADEVTYDVAITVDNRPVFQKPGVQHKYLSRWRKVFAAGGLVESAVTPDFASAIAAQAIPGYLPSVGEPARDPRRRRRQRQRLRHPGLRRSHGADGRAWRTPGARALSRLDRGIHRPRIAAGTRVRAAPWRARRQLGHPRAQCGRDAADARLAGHGLLLDRSRAGAIRATERGLPRAARAHRIIAPRRATTRTSRHWRSCRTS